MKSYIILLVAGFLLAISPGCKKVDDLTKAIDEQSITIGFDGGSLNQKIDSSSFTGQFTIRRDSVYLNVDSILTANKVDKNKIKSIKLKQITFTIKDGTPNFNFLKSMETRFAAGSNPTTLLASVNPVPTGVTTFSINVDNLDLKPYTDQKYFAFEFIGDKSMTLEQPVNMNIAFKYDVDAYLLK
jgi:hypothetical protein